MKLENLYRILPVVLFGMYPAMYFYARNVSLVLLPSLWRMLLLYLVAIALVYGVSLLLNRKDGVRAANAAVVFIVFVNTYGMIFQYLAGKDWILVRHYTLLPLVILLGVTLGWLVTNLGLGSSKVLWSAISVVFAVLIVFNLVKIVPAEKEKSRLRREVREVAAEVEVAYAGGKPPDIYYLLFDAFSGLEPMREYWHTPEVDEFKDFLLEKGFFVAEASKGNGIWTLHQMASRLNYTDYPITSDKELDSFFGALTDNNVMRFLKSRGYTTVVYEEITMFVKTLPEFNADEQYSIYTGNNSDVYLDEYNLMVLANTMAYPFTGIYAPETNENTLHMAFLDMALGSLAVKDTDVEPEFFYYHLMVPHHPFLYDENGENLDPSYYKDWDYYERYWVYASKLIEESIAALLENADPANPPIIILQSDHGVRVREDDKSKLPGFPEGYETDIFFSMYLPGYDISTLPQDLDPLNTFPIIFNHYFGEKIPLH